MTRTLIGLTVALFIVGLITLSIAILSANHDQERTDPRLIPAEGELRAGVQSSWGRYRPLLLDSLAQAPWRAPFYLSLTSRAVSSEATEAPFHKQDSS